MLRSFDADGQHFAFHAVENGPDTGKSIVEVEHGPQGARRRLTTRTCYSMQSSSAPVRTSF